MYQYPRLSPVLFIGCLSLLFAAPGSVNAASVLDVGDQRQVFIDGRFLGESKGVELVVHQPERTGHVVLRCDRPWEQRFGQYHSTLKDGDAYHMWYTFYGQSDINAPMVRSIAYACSRDGLNWEKPDLGLVELYGTRRNNVVLGHGFGGIKGATHGCMVFLDPQASPEERFRLVSNPEELGKALQVFSSPDGIHWELTHRDIMVFHSEKHHLDTQNVIFWDDRLGKYTAFIRKNQRPSGSQGRSVARAESDDLSHFPDVEQCPVVLGFDDSDPMYKDPELGEAIQIVDFYTNGTVKYPWVQDAYYMFPSEYFHYMGFLKDFRKRRPVNAGSLDVRFAASRDGISWNRYDRRAFLDLGLKGSWDSRSIYMAYGILESPDPNILYMYYCGSNALHGWDRDDKNGPVNQRLLTRAGLAPSGQQCGIGLLTLRRDGFISVRARYTGGDFITPPLRFKGERLVVNVDTSAVGQLQVEILDQQGQAVPGYALADSDEVHTANEINRTIAWNGESSLAPLKGRVVQLRFVMRDADLYAFQFLGD